MNAERLKRVRVGNKETAIPAYMPTKLSDMQPNDHRQFSTAMQLSQHGDNAQREYARAWFANALSGLKPFTTEPIMA